MLRNICVLAVTVVTAIAGILLPGASVQLAHLPALFMMTQLLLCFLATTDPATPLPKASLLSLPRFLLVKMVLVPLLCWVIIRPFFPDYALGVLLLAGSAVGVTAPFFAFLVAADAFFVIGAVIASSFIMPATLPLLASIALFAEGQSVQGLMWSCLGTAAFLGICMLVPFVIARLLWARCIGMAELLLKRRFLITLICIAGSNFVVFGRFSEPLLANSEMVADAFVVGLLLMALLFVPGLIMMRRLQPDQALGKIIGFTSLNSLLVVILSAEFFSLPEVLVATLFTLPIMCLGVPYQLCRNRLDRVKRRRPQN